MVERVNKHLVGTEEGAELFGVRPSNFVRDWAARPGFPEPSATLARGRLWAREDLLSYRARTSPRRAVALADLPLSADAKRWLPVIKRRIVRRFRPERIVLFGSQVRGDARRDSDVDLLIVLPNVGHRRRAAAQIQLCSPGSRSARTSSSRRRRMSTDWRTWSGRSSTRHSARDGRSMSTTDRRRALARRWLSKARTDLAVATVVLEKGPDMDAWACCFHAQQAAEKALKAILVARGVEPPYTHDIGALAAVMPDALSFDVSGDDLGDLTTYATGPRNVFDAGTEAEDPTWAEAERALVTAGRIYTAVLAHLGEL
jgi:HEPN domain-containing protein